MRYISLNESVVESLEQHAVMLYDFGFERAEICDEQLKHDVRKALTENVAMALSGPQFYAATQVLKYSLLALFASVYATE